MHSDGGLKLLIDRRIMTNDEGGIPEKMQLKFDKDLNLSFRLGLHPAAELTSAQAQRRRSVLAVQSPSFSFERAIADHIDDFARHSLSLIHI